MNNYTNEQLKQTLAKMLPEKVEVNHSRHSNHWILTYAISEEHPRDSLTCLSEEIKDTELLHLCWLVEETLTSGQRGQCAEYCYRLHKGIPEYHQDFHATWQQRTIALAQTLGIEI